MARSLNNVYRTGVYANRWRKVRRIGFVREVLFHASEPRVVGFVVQRPRLLMLLDRKDLYLAFDRAVFGEELSVPNESGAWDAGAAKRLGLDWDKTVVWQGMPVRAESGEPLGTVRDALFGDDGRLITLGLSSGIAADAAIGTRDIPVSMVRGFVGDAVVVSDEVLQVETSGGAAAVAGKGYAVAKDRATKVAKTATIVGKAASKVAGEVGADAGKKAGGWLRSVRDEFVGGMDDSDK